MEVTCGYKQLMEAAQVAERLVGKKESLPVLSCILITATKNNILLTATNLEAGVELTIPAKVEEEGMVAVPAYVLSQTIRTSPEDKLTLQSDGNTLIIGVKGGKTAINAIAHDEFPPLPKTDASGISIEKQALIEGISSVSYAASQSTIRPEFASVYLHTDQNNFTCAATDSFRLAEKKTTLTSPEDIPDTLIPTKNALELVHMLEYVSEDIVTLVVDDGQLSIAAGNTYFISRIVDATFPNYTAIIPKGFTTEVTALKADVIAALRKAKLFSHTAQQVSFSVAPKEKRCVVNAQHADIGEMHDTIEAVVEGEDIDIKFNITYLTDCFSSIPQDSVVLKFAGSGKPLVIQGVGDSSFTYLVMPLNR